jgi:hypothetical protein
MPRGGVYLGVMGNVTSLEQLAREFDRLFSRRVYRLETLDSYDAPNEREPYAAFLAGKPVDPGWRANWRRIAGDITASGREMARVHVLTEPASDYMRFMMLHGYPANVEAGEDVRIIGRTRAAEATLPDLDYWLFDDDLAAVLVYDAAGAVERVEWHSSGDAPMFLWNCCRWRDTALDLASPLAQYVTAHNISSERTAA